MEWVRVCWNVVATLPRMGLHFVSGVGYTVYAKPKRSSELLTPQRVLVCAVPAAIFFSGCCLEWLQSWWLCGVHFWCCYQSPPEAWDGRSGYCAADTRSALRYGVLVIGFQCYHAVVIGVVPPADFHQRDSGFPHQLFQINCSVCGEWFIQQCEYPVHALARG